MRRRDALAILAAFPVATRTLAQTASDIPAAPRNPGQAGRPHARGARRSGASFRSRRRTIVYELILQRLQAADLKL